jgi:hypothetical protein
MSNPTKLGIDSVDALPDRVAHRRKIVERLAVDAQEFAPDDPSRTVQVAGGKHPTLGPAVRRLRSRTPRLRGYGARFPRTILITIGRKRQETERIAHAGP